MLSILGSLLGGAAPAGAADTAASNEKEEALTAKVAEHFTNAKEPSSQLAQSGVSNVISQDERLQLISPNQMVHGDFVVNPDIGSQSRQSTQLVMNQVANSTNEIVFEFSSNQSTVFMKDIRLEMEVTISAEVIIGNEGLFPPTRLIGGQYWWTQFFNQVRVEINGSQCVITDIGALRAIMLGMESLNPNDGIDMGALRRHIETFTVNGGDYWQEVDLERPNSTNHGAVPVNIVYQNTKFYQTVYLPWTFFDIKELLAPNSILKVTFVRNNAPVTVFATSGRGSGFSTSVLDPNPLGDIRVWQLQLTALSQWLTVFECNPAKIRADALAHTVSGTPNQIVWYLPQHLNFPMNGGAFQDWGTYAVPGQGPYATYLQEVVFQGTGVAPNNYVIVPEVTWQVHYVQGGALVNSGLTWTEAVPGLVTLEKVSINSVDMNYPSSVLPANLLTELASGSWEAYQKLAKYRARSAITERFSQKQLSAGTWKKMLRWIEAGYSPNLGNTDNPSLINAGDLQTAKRGVLANHASEVFAQIPWEKMRKMPYTIVNTVLNEDPFVIVTPQRGTVRCTLRLMQNIFLFYNQPVRGTALAQGAGFEDNINTNTPYMPYLGEQQLYRIDNQLCRPLVLKNPSLNIRVVSLNITMTEYGEYGMTVTNTNLYEKIGAVGGV